MDLNKLQLSSVLYFLDKLIISAGGKDFDVPRPMLGRIEIIKNYLDDIYPLYYVQVGLPLWFYDIVMKNPDNIFVTLRLQHRYATNSDESDPEGKGKFITELSGKYKATIPHASPASKKTEINIDDFGNNYTFNELAMLELSLYNPQGYNASFTPINAVLSNATVQTAAAFCFSKIGARNVLMDRPDNAKVYREFKIPPMTVAKNLLRICEVYNYHSGGSILFFDLDTTYLIGNKTGCHVWRTNEYKTTQIINIGDYSDAYDDADGVYLDTKNKSTIISLADESWDATNITGGPGINNRGATRISISTTQGTLSCYSPNKDFVINLDDTTSKKVNGKYRIERLNCTLIPKGEFLEPAFGIKLLK